MNIFAFFFSFLEGVGGCVSRDLAADKKVGCCYFYVLRRVPVSTWNFWTDFGDFFLFWNNFDRLTFVGSCLQMRISCKANRVKPT